MGTYLIPLNGSKPGKSSFSWHVGKEFFAAFDNTDILDADLAVEAASEKSAGRTKVDCTISGNVKVLCDRCLEELTLPVEASAALVVRFGEEPACREAMEEEGGREAVYVDEEAQELDLSQTIYDYACLSLPLQRVHPEGECSSEMLEYLAGGAKCETEVKDQEQHVSDSPFAVLKGMFEAKD